MRRVYPVEGHVVEFREQIPVDRYARLVGIRGVIPCPEKCKGRRLLWRHRHAGKRLEQHRRELTGPVVADVRLQCHHVAHRHATAAVQEMEDRFRSTAGCPETADEWIRVVHSRSRLIGRKHETSGWIFSLRQISERNITDRLEGGGRAVQQCA